MFSGNIQGIFRVFSGNIQGILREFQGVFWVFSGCFQGVFFPVPFPFVCPSNLKHVVERIPRASTSAWNTAMEVRSGLYMHISQHQRY